MSTADPGAFAERILGGEADAVDHETLHGWLRGEADTWALMNAADQVRRDRFGNRVHLCSIINAKEGGCPEDCGFCSQSRHYATHVAPAKFTSLAPEEPTTES